MRPKIWKGNKNFQRSPIVGSGREFRRAKCETFRIGRSLLAAGARTWRLYARVPAANAKLRSGLSHGSPRGNTPPRLLCPIPVRADYPNHKGNKNTSESFWNYS